ncbi:MAG: hypothetical protein KTR13_04470 [Saprospiraceae bacterium]|nr:hypothetical protein [Saprospiraceae bacterium]
MQIKNNYSKPIWWWSYKPKDTTYAIALAKGEIPANTTKGWRDDSFPKYKLQIARDWKSLGINNYTTILDPGEIYTHDNHFIVDSKGKASKAAIHVSELPTEERRMVTIQFVDRRTERGSREEEVTTEFYKAFSKSMTESESKEDSQSWKIGGKIGGTIKGAKVGANVGFESKVVNTIGSRYEEVVSQAFTEKRTTVLTFPPKKISVIKTVWMALIKTGKVTYFGYQADFSVPVGAETSSTLVVEAAYNKPEDMDEESRAAWDKLVGG